MGAYPLQVNELGCTLQASEALNDGNSTTNQLFELRELVFPRAGPTDELYLAAARLPDHERLGPGGLQPH